MGVVGMNTYRIALVLTLVVSIGFLSTAHAAITVDGDISDWDASLIQIDSTGDNTGKAIDLTSWGATIEGGYLYCFAEAVSNISIYAEDTNAVGWFGAWIDADIRGGPGNTARSLDTTSDMLGHEWSNGNFESMDIGVEIRLTANPLLGNRFAFFGSNDTASVTGNLVSAGTYAYSGRIIEWRVPVTEITSELGLYPDNVTPNGNRWKVGVRIDGLVAGDMTGLGGDNSDTRVYTEAGTTTATNSGFFHVSEHWTNGDPLQGDTAIISGGVNMILSNATPTLASLTLTNAWLTFTNYDARLNALEIAILNRGTNTHVINSDTNRPWTNAYWDIDGRIHHVCSNFTLAAGGVINVDLKGYQGLFFAGNRGLYGAGPGGGYMVVGGQNPGGAGHGGGGGTGGHIGGPAYDSTNAPSWPGSAGGGSWNYFLQGGAGGGLVRIEATNTVINGLITANGGNGGSNNDGAGGGSGGSIYIHTKSLSGSGTIRANGGTGNNYAGGGAGGRVALHYETLNWTGYVLANGASGRPNQGYPASAAGGIGSLYSSDAQVVSPLLDNSSFRHYGPFTSLVFNNFVLTNSSYYWLSAQNSTIYVTNNLWVGAGSTLRIGGEAGDTARTILEVGGNAVVTGGSLIVASGITNMTHDNDGELVKVHGDFIVRNAGRIIPIAYQYPPQYTNAGGAVRFEAKNFTLAQGATVNLKEYGYAGAYQTQSGGGTGTNSFGPGGGRGYWNAGGGGYGGKGGDGGQANKWGGPAYGSSNAPVYPGSGGSYTSYQGDTRGGHGGGLFRLKASGTVTISGTIDGDGGGGQAYSGGGSGGGVFIQAKTFGGSGTIQARGGNGGTYSGGGGGGRIAIHRIYDSWSGTLSYPASVTPGAAGGIDGKMGETGTVVWVQIPAPGTALLLK